MLAAKLFQGLCKHISLNLPKEFVMKMTPLTREDAGAQTGKGSHPRSFSSSRPEEEFEPKQSGTQTRAE